MYQIIFSLLFIFILLIVYIQRPSENILEPLRQVKRLLKDTNYRFPERFLSPPIIHLNRINYLPRGEYAGYPILLIPDIGGCKLYNRVTSFFTKKSTQIWPTPKNLSPFLYYANQWKSRFEMDIKNGVIIDKLDMSI